VRVRAPGNRGDDPLSGTYLQLRLGAERYALPVEDIVEVTLRKEITEIPGSAAAVLGLANLRGSVIPVYDLARVLGVDGADGGERLVVAAQGGRQAGLTVDEVTGIEPLPELTEPGSGLLSGATLVEDSLVGVLDTARLFDELEQKGGV
jgi:purine-binding chemotaxis protein CheW